MTDIKQLAELALKLNGNVSELDVQHLAVAVLERDEELPDALISYLLKIIEEEYENNDYTYSTGRVHLAIDILNNVYLYEEDYYDTDDADNISDNTSR